MNNPKQLTLKAVEIEDVGPVHGEFEAGQCAGLSGPSGAGKTLLLRAVADLVPLRGEIRLAGVRQEEVPPALWRQRVGFLPAESFWWFDTVGEHFRHGSPAALAELGLAFDILQRRVDQVSTGERQRLALLRLLAERPEVLLLDEPTGSLDSVATAQVEALLKDYQHHRGATLIWVSHHPDQLDRVANHRLQLVDGGLETLS